MSLISQLISSLGSLILNNRGDNIELIISSLMYAFYYN
jgi:hypothetical protein